MTTNVLQRKETCSDRDNFRAECDQGITLSITILGASGDLAKKKTYPALYFLFMAGLLPTNTHIIGYARSSLTSDELREKLRPYLSGGDDEEKAAFLSICSYLSGPYDAPDGYQNLGKLLKERERVSCHCSAGRLFYLALPPNTFASVCAGLKEYCDDIQGPPECSWIRVIVEKPFGRDLMSSELLADDIGAHYPENQLYRIDHYLGKEMVQNLLLMRFANMLLSPVWNKDNIANVQITFKEDIGTQGRGGYFDEYGIIRDVIQNHLMQLVCFVAMEKPISIHPDDIRDEKVKALRCIRPIKEEDVVLGQYEGYTDDETVPDNSKCPTFASVVLYIDNDRWKDVPFYIKAGKALEERKAEIRIQLKATPHFLFGDNSDEMRNEIVLRLQPDEAVYMKVIVKAPGLNTQPVISELDLTYKQRYKEVNIPDAYPKLIMDCIRGEQQHFVRRDELRAAWALFTPLLKKTDAGELPVHLYPWGSRGPEEADQLRERIGYVKNKNYKWGNSEAK